MNWVLVFLLGAAAVVLALAWWMIASSVTKIKGLYEQIRELQDTNQKISSQKKSSEVRVGQIAENMAPFLKDFKYDPKSCHFLGQPIDYIIYGDDEVVFVEVKSGEAKLSSKQRKIRENISNGNVRFEVFRVK
jgi:predicted Holliday junction resolvase-like endonuclease|tara:strand:+ start:439 stop:837 length:399 start_codon:yes stop_codon:yes gene_type:complete